MGFIKEVSARTGAGKGSYCLSWTVCVRVCVCLSREERDEGEYLAIQVRKQHTDTNRTV